MRTSSRGSNSGSDAENAERHCNGCGRTRGVSQFSAGMLNADGKTGSRCRECVSEYNRDYYTAMKRRRREEEVKEEEEMEDLEARHVFSSWDGVGPIPEPDISDLYVMQNARIAAEYKIGRSSDVEARRLSLQRSQNFRMQVVALFPKAGDAETRVHELLSYCRVNEEAAGKEWFRCTVQTAFSAIGQALAEQEP